MNRKKTRRHRLPSRSTANKQGDNDNSTQSEAMNQIEDPPNPNLPERLLPVDSYSDGARLNIYSRPEYLGTIATLLKGSKEWEQIKNSQFGKLFQLPVARCSHSGKLLHGLLSRQLVTEKKHEIWFVFGGHPMRFSIREFHIVTGLRCSELPTQDEVDKHKDRYLSVWHRLFGNKTMVTVADVLDMLLQNDKTTDKKKQFSSWKKLCLALIAIVDGVVVCHDQSFVSSEFVEMLNDVDYFLDYPWGRLAFTATIRRFGPPKDATNPIGKLKKRLKQKTSACYGFPLALQLQALESIPVILERIKDPLDLRNFTERSAEGLSFAVLLHETKLHNAEVDDKLLVAHTLDPKGIINETELVWETEVSDPKVDFMLKLINEGHVFKPFEWPVLKAANQEVNIQEKRILDKAKPKHFTRCSMKEKEVFKPPTNIHKHTSQKKPTAKVHVGGESNDPGYVTLAHLDDMKEWILKQNEDLRNKIREDVTELVGSKSHSQDDTPEGGASNLRRSNGLNTNCLEMMANTDATPTETRKRKRVEVHSISTRSESACDIEGGKDVQCLGTQAREGGEGVQSLWNEDGNAQSSGTFDQYDDYGDALKITQEDDLMQEINDSGHCPNCVKTKESMMREIENLKLSLQLYQGHSLNHLNYDELLRFEIQLESSLHNARKFEFMRQQQQTDKYKGKGKEILMDEGSTQLSNPVRALECQRQEDDDIMHRQVKKEFPSCGEEATGVRHLPQLPQDWAQTKAGHWACSFR
ncbi:PREDICTED: uncharacterized protein LOC104757509 isoform X2 [Camelina sativa]|uniref:Uncharacterized protein LOC104757509 isoform X2 n=1 Tax=Camelina sativa TaxID=90675 RepID=A0ABM0WZV5_CAMSA|nr:PREDICTED: uncharacterized protein LOC104757509 isoform X2 [Camelina sativa]